MILLAKTDMSEYDQLLLNHFAQYITDHKKLFVEKVLGQRTRHVTVVLEDIYQSQNASAAVRTCECMGIQDIHIIENESKYQVNRKVLKGANKWIDLFRYKDKKVNNAETCFRQLKMLGYNILATDPSGEGISVSEVDLKNKIALVFGNELRGLSAFAINNCDQKVRIPMYGFTESFNISASVAICLNTLLLKLREADFKFTLSDEEKDTIKLKWYRKIVKHSEIIEREFLKTIQYL